MVWWCRWQLHTEQNWCPPKSSNVLSGSDNDNDVELSESGSDNDDDVEFSESGPPPKLVKLSSAPTTRDPIETFLFVMYKQQNMDVGDWSCSVVVATTVGCGTMKLTYTWCLLTRPLDLI